jgi:hypothetical protein
LSRIGPGGQAVGSYGLVEQALFKADAKYASGRVVQAMQQHKRRKTGDCGNGGHPHCLTPAWQVSADIRRDEQTPTGCRTIELHQFLLIGPQAVSPVISFILKTAVPVPLSKTMLSFARAWSVHAEYFLLAEYAPVTPDVIAA